MKFAAMQRVVMVYFFYINFGVGELVEAEKLVHEVAQTVQKMEQAAQEHIAKNVAAELIEAEKSFIKISNNCVDKSMQAIKNKPKGVDTLKLLEQNLTIAESRSS